MDYVVVAVLYAADARHTDHFVILAPVSLSQIAVCYEGLCSQSLPDVIRVDKGHESFAVAFGDAVLPVPGKAFIEREFLACRGLHIVVGIIPVAYGRVPVEVHVVNAPVVRGHGGYHAVRLCLRGRQLAFRPRRDHHEHLQEHDIHSEYYDAPHDLQAEVHVVRQIVRRGIEVAVDVAAYIHKHAYAAQGDARYAAALQCKAQIFGIEGEHAHSDHRELEPAVHADEVYGNAHVYDHLEVDRDRVKPQLVFLQHRYGQQIKGDGAQICPDHRRDAVVAEKEKQPDMYEHEACRKAVSEHPCSF